MQTAATRTPLLALLCTLLVTSLVLLTGCIFTPIASQERAPALESVDPSGTSFWDERQKALDLAPVAFNTLDEQPRTGVYEDVYERASYNELPE